MVGLMVMLKCLKNLFLLVAKGRKEDLEDLIIDAASGENQDLLNKIISGIGGMETGGFEFIRDMFKEPNGLLVLAEDSVTTKEKEKIFQALVEFGNKEDSGDNQWRRHAILNGINENPALKKALVQGQTGLRNAWDASGNFKGNPNDADADKYFENPPVLASMFAVHINESEKIQVDTEIKKQQDLIKPQSSLDAASEIRTALIADDMDKVEDICKRFCE